MLSQVCLNVIVIIIVLMSALCFATPLLGYQTNFEDNPRSQIHPKPIFLHCDEIGNHLNCMLYCKSRGHMSGNCGGDFTCNCF